MAGFTYAKGHLANVPIRSATVGLHRRFSGLLFDPVEMLSSCSTTSLDKVSYASTTAGSIHTAWCMKAAQAQVRLFAVPTLPRAHTPFTVCMLVTATAALLSAYKYQLAGSSLRIVRDQIRMSIGCLRSFATIWPRAEISLQEVQTIAREMLVRPISDDSIPCSATGTLR